MELVDSLKLIGFVEIWESKDKGKTFQKIKEIKNLWTDEGIKNVAALLQGVSTGYNVGIFAVGSGASNVAKTDTTIQEEYERLAIDVQTYTYTGGYHWVINELNLESGEGNGTIRKLGLIAHSPTTDLLNYNASDPDEAGHEWKLCNVVDVLLPDGKIKDSSTVLKFIWKLRLG